MKKIQGLAKATNEYCDKNELKQIKTIVHYILEI